MAEPKPKQSNPVDSGGHRKRLRERFFRAGIDAFSPHELVELLLTLAIPRKDVKPLAKVLIARFGSLRAIVDASRTDLLAVKGVTEASVFALEFLRSLIPLYLQSQIEVESLKADSDGLSDYWRARIGHTSNEVFEIALFDPGMRLMRNGVVTHSHGAADQTVVFPKEVIRMALNRNAYAIAFAHNHPSGDPAPSDADKLLTRQLVLAATAAQIKVVDHLVVTATHVFSFRKEGLL